MKHILIALSLATSLCSISHAELKVRIVGLDTVEREAKEEYKATYTRDPGDKQKADEKNDKPRYSWMKLNDFVRKILKESEKMALVEFAGPVKSETAKFNCNIVVNDKDDSGSKEKSVLIVKPNNKSSMAEPLEE